MTEKIHFLKQDLLNAAAGFFKIVGESPAECDTIIGRQSMASAHFLRKQFDEVLVYLDSIRVRKKALVQFMRTMRNITNKLNQ